MGTSSEVDSLKFWNCSDRTEWGAVAKWTKALLLRDIINISIKKNPGLPPGLGKLLKKTGHKTMMDDKLG